MRLFLWVLLAVACLTAQAGADSTSTPVGRLPGSPIGKTLVMKTGNLTTTTTTAGQVVLTYTVTTGKTFFLTYFHGVVRLTTPSATAAVMGTWSLETPSGTKVFTMTIVNPTTSRESSIVVPISDPLPIAAGQVIRVVTTPAAATSTLWVASFGGYER